METWPNFFIVGARKTGTSSLHQYLSHHPQIFMCPIKEPGYFHGIVPKSVESKTIRNREKYLNLFRKRKDEVAIGEVTSYLQDPDSPKLIHSVIPDARIIIILRDPVERVFVHYLHHFQHDDEKQSFSQTIRRESSDDYETNCKYNERNREYANIIQRGFYSKQVKRYYDTFGKQNVKVLIYEEYAKSFKGLVKEILKFLKLNQEFDFEEIEYNAFQIPKVGRLGKFIISNKTIGELGNKLFSPETKLKISRRVLYEKNPQKPKLLPEDRKFLENLYRRDILETQKIFGRTLPWLKNWNNNLNGK